MGLWRYDRSLEASDGRSNWSLRHYRSTESGFAVMSVPNNAKQLLSRFSCESESMCAAWSTNARMQQAVRQTTEYHGNQNYDYSRLQQLYSPSFIDQVE